MGCACSSTGRVELPARDEGATANAAATTEHALLIQSGAATDVLLLSQLVQVSTQLSIMASEHGRSEQDLCDAAVAARAPMFSVAADRMTVWCLQPGASGADGKLAAISSDMAGQTGLIIDLGATSPPCEAIRACAMLGATPVLANLADQSARRELEARYGPLHAVLYVPINVHTETDFTQIGIIELVLNDHNGAASNHDASEGNGPFSPLRCKHLAQLGINLASSLLELRLADKTQQGERLLYRMLPRHVVAQLQTRAPQDFLVESCDRAFVLFSDIVKFTNYCSTRDPQNVVVMLNSMFATFDALLSKHSVHKVTTIGDAYVAATGLPFMTSKSPQLDIVEFALDMVAAVRSFVTDDGERMQIRVGIHVGPVAAGIVGVAMPRYCLFGETVAIAEQLEERSESGRILISEDMRNSLMATASDDSSNVSLDYENGEKSIELPEGGKLSTYLLSAQVKRRRQSLAALETMASQKLSYFKHRTTADAFDDFVLNRVHEGVSSRGRHRRGSRVRRGSFNLFWDAHGPPRNAHVDRHPIAGAELVHPTRHSDYDLGSFRRRMAEQNKDQEDETIATATNGSSAVLADRECVRVRRASAPNGSILALVGAPHGAPTSPRSAAGPEPGLS